MKFRKKPVVIEAFLFTGNAYVGAIEFLGDSFGGESRNADDPFILIKTLEGDMKARWGDYIIKGVKGEFYPCKPDIFKATYEPVETGGGEAQAPDPKYQNLREPV